MLRTIQIALLLCLAASCSAKVTPSKAEKIVSGEVYSQVLIKTNFESIDNAKARLLDLFAEQSKPNNITRDQRLLGADLSYLPNNLLILQFIDECNIATQRAYAIIDMLFDEEERSSIGLMSARCSRVIK